MRFTESLKKTGDFKKVYNTGKWQTGYLLVVYVRPNGLAINHLGISVSRKVGKAVVRNRIKRWLKAQYRLLEPNIKRGLNIVVVARKPAGLLDRCTGFCALGLALQKLLDKHKDILECQNGKTAVAAD